MITFRQLACNGDYWSVTFINSCGYSNIQQECITSYSCPDADDDYLSEMLDANCQQVQLTKHYDVFSMDFDTYSTIVLHKRKDRL